MKLTEYKNKRNFEKTLEPKGKVKNTNNALFVIQYHKARTTHYDFRLEHNGVLLSWAIPKGLSFNPNEKRLAVMVEDHPIDYANFEGIIPKGNYGAGTVEIYDKGVYMPLIDVSKGLKKGHLKILLNGEKHKGVWSFVKLDEKNWLAIKGEDEFVKDKKNDIKLPFTNCSVMLATLTEKIPTGKEWIFEIKYDGYRIVAYKQNEKIKLVSRNGVDYTNKFKNIAESLKELEENFVIDGEVVSLDQNGKSDFGLLQTNLKHNKGNVFYVVFDLLAINNEDLRKTPLYKRKERLERLLYNLPKNVIFSQHFNKGKECFEFAKNNELEGLVAKKQNSYYHEKRSDEWLKIKCYLRQEFVIGGYTTTEKNELLSAILLGYYKDQKLIYVGKVGTGFDDNTKKLLSQAFKKLLRKTCPFYEFTHKKAIWLKPVLVAEIKYTEITKDKLLRQPSFIGLREDKKAKEITLDE